MQVVVSKRELARFRMPSENNKPPLLCHDQQSNAIITAQNIKGEYQENKGICRLVSGNLNLRHRRQTPCMQVTINA